MCALYKQSRIGPKNVIHIVECSTHPILSK